ncbi:MAG: DUF502 domain-containing protein [Flavobacteriales bacterium]|nr:DUF502 domain-containing protein [Flavobacteriales bacterium]
MTWKQVMRAGVRFFLSGLLYTAPVVVTAYILFELFTFLDGLVPSKYPGIGILFIVLFITLMGILGSSFLLRPINRYFRSLVDRIPLVKTIFYAIRDVLSAFVGEKKRFTKPVLVQVNAAGMEKLGFITSEDLSRLGIPEHKIAVYLPHSINFSGNLFIVTNEMVTPLEANSSEVMKFIVSGGVMEVEPKIPTEWNASTQKEPRDQ